jgi:transmembrane sensor
MLIIMADSKYKWSILLEKYLNKDISEEELAELHRQMDASPGRRKQFEEVTDPDYFRKTLMELHNIDIEKNWQRLTEKMPHLKPSPVVRLIKNNSWKFYATAACIAALVIGIASYYVITKDKTPNKPTASTAAIQKEPAIKNYSYIQLSTGQEFRLPELADVVLFDSNGTTIRRQGSLIKIETKGISQVHDETIFYMVVAPKRQEKLMLPDGSVYTLDAASYIGFNLYRLGQERAVKIYGQAYCDVDKRSKKEFVVHLNDSVDVNVTGTRFNVRNYKNENIRVALISGNVKLTRGKQTYIMHEGQEVKLNNDKKFELVKDVKIEEEIAWTEQLFTFENRNVFQAMDQIGPYYNYPVRFKDSASMPDMKANGRIPKFNNPDSTRSIIELYYDVHIEIRNDSFIVSK